MDAQQTAPPELSLQVWEIIRLAESGVENEAILTFIESVVSPFDLKAEDIIYLNDIGISTDIITAMLRRDGAVKERAPGVAGTKTNQFVYEQKFYGTGTNIAQKPVYATNAPTEVEQFYEPLAPYGTWIDLEGQGWAWQPTVVVIDRQWRPYWQGGRWIYSDVGWYWHSDYSWGWAPFHYGRWNHHHRHGWLWHPDLVWGPAWVTWRVSDVYCGWAPLPPGAHFVIGQGWFFNNVSVGINFDFRLGPDYFNFVHLRHLHERRPHSHGIHVTPEIHSSTSILNNHTVGPNNRIINRGVSVDRVAAASGRQIQAAVVTDVPARRSGPAIRERVERVGARTVIQRAVPAAPAAARSMVAQRVDAGRGIVRPATPPTASGTVVPRAGGQTARRAAVPQRIAPRRAQSQPESAPRTLRVAPAGEGPSTPPAQPPQTIPPRTAPPTQTAPPRRSAPELVSPPRAIPTPGHIESPKGREQRAGNGPGMNWAPRAPATRPQGPPPGQPQRQRNR